jgi:hypothetical protein
MLVAPPEQVSHNRSLASSAIDRALPLDASVSSPTGNGHVTAPLRMEQSVDVTGGPSQLVHLSSVVGGAAGAGSVARATAPGRLLAGTSEAIGKRLRNGPSAPAPYPSSCQSGTPSRSATAAGSPTTRRVSRLARSGTNQRLDSAPWFDVGTGIRAPGLLWQLADRKRSFLMSSAAAGMRRSWP